jgi:hypothetical protein
MSDSYHDIEARIDRALDAMKHEEKPNISHFARSRCLDLGFLAATTVVTLYPIGLQRIESLINFKNKLLSTI